MSDENSDGIWTITLSLPAGPFEYKYIVDGFSGQENLINDMVSGADCAPVTDFFGYANRIETVGAGSVFNSVYGVCGDCIDGQIADCTDPEAVNYNPNALSDDGSCAYAVTFVLDMSNTDFPFTTPEVNGSFNGWCGTCNPMTDEGGGIWMTTINILNGFREFKFSTDDFTNEESLSEGSSCTWTTDGFTNRTLNVTGNMTYGPVAWEECSICSGDLNNDGTIDTQDFIEFNSAFGTSCTDCPADLNGDGIVNVEDFLIFNSLFGASCP